MNFGQLTDQKSTARILFLGKAWGNDQNSGEDIFAAKGCLRTVFRIIIYDILDNYIIVLVLTSSSSIVLAQRPRVLNKHLDGKYSHILNKWLSRTWERHYDEDCAWANCSRKFLFHRIKNPFTLSSMDSISLRTLNAIVT